MGFLRFILGVVAFIIAVKVLGILLGIIGFALKLAWLAIVVGLVVLVAYGVYKLIAPRPAQQV